VSKTVLGRGLTDLLEGARRASRPTSPTDTVRSPSAPSLSAGMKTLIQAGPAPQPQVNHRSTRATLPARLLRLSLIGGDVLLVVQAIFLMKRAEHPVSWIDAGFCFLALALGAWLSCLAVGWTADHAQPVSRHPEGSGCAKPRN
jgi:hypothetical protein